MHYCYLKNDLRGFITSLQKGEFDLSLEQQYELAQISDEIQGQKHSVRLRIFTTHIIESDNSSLASLFESYNERVHAISDAHFKASDTLKTRKKFAGLDEINELYYKDSMKIRADLEAFAKVSGKNVLELSTTDYPNEAICSNGKSVKFQLYISRARVALCLANNITEAHSKGSDTVKSLKKLAGFYERDELYYKDPVKVKADLEAFAQVCGKSVFALNTSDDGVEAICSNGESVKFGTYVKNAGVPLGLANNYIEAKTKMAGTLTTLKRLAGVDVIDLKEHDKRDELYYKDPVKVKADLESFAKACGKNILELNASDHATEIICANGKSMKFLSYIKNAGVAHGLAINTSDPRAKSVETLNILKRLAGMEIEEYIKRDDSYYNDTKTVKADMEAFGKVCGKSVFELNSSDYVAEVICLNGEKVRLRRYLINAGVALGIAKDSTDAQSKIVEILIALKKLSGLDIKGYKEYDERNELYYKDPVKVKADMEAFAQVCGKSAVTLCTGDQDASVEAICSNGERVKFRTYIRNAAVAMSLVEKYIDVDSKKAETLKILKNLAGLDVKGYKEYDKRDELYYKDPVKVKADLESFAKVCRKNFLELNASDDGIEAICANGESVKFKTYICNAGVVLGLAGDTIDARVKKVQILKVLKKFAGADERDELYYVDSKKVRADLESFANVCRKNALQLSTSDYALEAICTNGESVKFMTYIYNAGVTLGLAVNTIDASAKKVVILKALKKLAGFDVKEYDVRDDLYYNDSKRVRADLEAFAQVCGKSAVTLSTADQDASVVAICTNGESVKFGTYIRNAGVAFGLAENSKGASCSTASILQLLKKIAL